MKVRYQFVTGDATEVEAPDEVGTAIADIEHKANLQDRAETRRHYSIDALDYEGAAFSSDDDIPALFDHGEDVKALRRAMRMLSPEQRELVRRVFFDEESVTQIALDEGVSRAAIHRRLNRIYEKLKINF